MKNIKLLIKSTSLLISVFTLNACTSSPVDVFEANQEEQTKLENKILNEQVDNMPEWFLSPPSGKNRGIYGVGMSSSKDIQFSKLKSQLQAEFDLSKKFGQIISGQERSHIEEINTNGQVQKSASQTIDKLVNKQNIAGYEIVSTESFINEGVVSIYTLLYMSFDKYLTVNDTNKKTFLKNAEAAYQKLEERVE
jgi:hypothetical protein